MKEKPILPEVVFREGVEWRLIPGYVATYAGANGVIAYVNSDSELIKPTVVEWKTTKGTYLYAKVIKDDYNVLKKAIHQLVCLAWKGPPPNTGRIYEPNHIDGDKHNNKPSNLEWTTRKDNVQHCYEIGGAKTGLRITAKNIITGEEEFYYNLRTMARKWDIPHQRLLAILANHQTKPWNDTWVFTVDDELNSEVNRNNACAISFKDYVTGEITIVSDIRKAMFKTGVKHGTINYRVSLPDSAAVKHTLISRYCFQKVTEPRPWPVFTKEEALASEMKYNKTKA